MSIKSYILDNKLLLLIILVATTLRFWNFFEIPLTHDEISALNRTHFDNFSDLIEYGVKADTHPPGIQVFTYYWVELFGYEQWVVKLPFILMGIGSLLLAFSIFKKWSNETVALLVISFLAILQFTVMYSQIARPYISGMFLVLCMVYFWDGLVNRPQKNFWRNLLLTGIFGALCGYNHHFSLLAAFMVGLTGLFIIERKYLLKYLSLGFIIVLLYLPNIPIFLHQLERGGVGEWLGAPTPHFIIDFFSYCFNHSIALMSIFMTIVAIGIYNFKKGKSMKWVAISALWFFGVWVIGYYYSVYRNPVLQHSMLIFFFPFMLFTFLGWIPKLGTKLQASLVLAVLFIGTTSLVLQRKHFEVFYANRYFQMKEDAAKLDHEKTCFVFATYPHFLEIDFPRNIDFPNDYLAWEANVNSIQEFEQYVINSDKEQLFLGIVEQFPKELIAIAQYYYPYIKEVNYTSGASSYVFGKEGTNAIEPYLQKNLLTHPSFNHDVDKYNDDGSYTDSSEWSLGGTMSTKYQHIYDHIEVRAKIKVSSPEQEVVLVAEIPNPSGGDRLFWAGKSTKEAVFNPSDSTMVLNILFSIDHVTRNENILPDLKTYFWNISKSSFTVLEFNSKIYPGNRNKYCLLESF